MEAEVETLHTLQEQELQSTQEEQQEEILSKEKSEKPDHSILFSEPETTEKHGGGYLSEYEATEQKTAGSTSSKSLDKDQSNKTLDSEVAQRAHSNSEMDSSNGEELLGEPSQMQAEPEAEAEAELEPELELKADPEPVKDEVIIINLMCTDQGDEFQGSELSAALESQGLVHGNMDIFHYESGSGADMVRFSVANILNPGTFPRGKLEYFYTPGVCFFMTLTPGVSNLQAFNKLLSVARGVTSRLGGELKDESRQYLTHQRVEEIRTRMGEFQRENLLG